MFWMIRGMIIKTKTYHARWFIIKSGYIRWYDLPYVWIWWSQYEAPSSSPALSSSFAAWPWWSLSTSPQAEHNMINQFPSITLILINNLNAPEILLCIGSLPSGVSKTRWSPRTRMLTRMLMVQMSKHMVMPSRTIPVCNSLFEQSCTCFPCYQSAVWSGKCRVWSVECKVWSGECRVCKV